MIRQSYANFAAGMVDSPAGGPMNAPANSLSLLENGRVDKYGVIRSRWGSQKSASPGLTACRGFTSLRLTSGTTEWVGAFGTTLYSSKSGWTLLDTDAEHTKYMWVWTGGDVAGTPKVFGCNGASVYSYDGTTLSELTGWGTGMSYLAYHNNRLWGAAATNSILKASEIDDPTNITTPDGLSLPINTGDGEPIRGLMGAGDLLLVFKISSVAWVDGFGNSDVVVAAGSRGLSRSVGTTAPRSIVTAGDNGVVWLSARGIEIYRPGQGIQLISGEVRGLVSSLDYWTSAPAGMVYRAKEDRLIDACYYPKENEYWLVCRDGASSDYLNNRIVKVNLTTGAVYYDTYPETFLAAIAIGQASTTSRDLEPFAYGTDGHLRQLEKENTNRDDIAIAGTGGDAYTMKARTRLETFGYPTRRKRLREIRVMADATDAACRVKTVVSNGVDSPTLGSAMTPSFSSNGIARFMVSERGVNLAVQIEHTSDADAGDSRGAYMAIDVGAELMMGTGR